MPTYWLSQGRVEETGADKTKRVRAMAGKKGGKEKKGFFNFPARPVKKL